MRSGGSKAAGHVKRSGGGDGELWVEQWREYRLKHPEQSAAAGALVMFDKYKADFPHDYQQWERGDKELIAVCCLMFSLACQQ